MTTTVDAEALRLDNLDARQDDIENNAPPIWRVAPAITGTAQVGQTLTLGNGTWAQTGLTYAYQWYKAGSPVSGATASTYVPVVGDIGATLTGVVTASNGNGTGFKTSAATAAVIAAAPTYEAETTAYLAAMAVQPNTTVANAIDALVKAIKSGATSSSNIFAKLGWLSFNGKIHDIDAGKISLVAPAKVATHSGTLTFTANTQIAATGTAGAGDIDLGINRSGLTGSNGSAQNSVAFGFGLTNPGARTSSLYTLGQSATGATIFVQLGTSGNVNVRCGGATQNVLTDNTAGVAGRYAFSRIVSTGFKGWKDGVALNSGADFTNASSAPVTGNLHLFRNGASSGPTYSDHALGYFWMGSGLTAAEIADLDTALSVFMAAF